MSSFPNVNPFTERQTREVQATWIYKFLTTLTWLFTVLISIYYTFGMPKDTKEHGGKTLWDLNRSHHTLFALNSSIVSLWWALVFILQIAYLWRLFSIYNEDVQAAAGVGRHFIINNILQSSFIIVFVHRHFFWAELLLIFNLINLLILYFGHNTYPHLIHVPVASAPMSWTFVALYWNGAIAADTHNSLPQLVAIVSTWGILAYGSLFLIIFKDYTVTLSLSILCGALAVEQFLTHSIIWQWISGFAIMGLLFILTLLVGIPSMFGKELCLKRGQSVIPEIESAPLLEESLEQQDQTDVVTTQM